MESIDDIRKKSIVEIKEKIKMNPKYLNPCNKERLEDMKRLGFIWGNDFIFWMQNNEIIIDPTDVNREVRNKTIENTGCKTDKEYRDRCARDVGFKDQNERQREWAYKAGRSGIAIEANEDCPSHFGEFTESLMIHRYPGAKKMPYGNPGFDYLWIDEEGKEIKIDNKGRCMSYPIGRSPRFDYVICHNNIADIFVLSGWDNREDLNPLFALEFKKNDMARYGIGKRYVLKEFWNREGIGIRYPEGLAEFKDHQIDIDWLKELLNKLKDNGRL